jgi:hypothetical protein
MKIAGTAMASLFAPTADAALIVDQQPTADIGLPSTLFTLTPTALVEEIDSFTTLAAYRLGTLTAFTSSDRLGAAHLGQRVDLLGRRPAIQAPQLVTTAFGTLDASHDIVVDFGGAPLPAWN